MRISRDDEIRQAIVSQWDKLKVVRKVWTWVEGAVWGAQWADSNPDVGRTGYDRSLGQYSVVLTDGEARDVLNGVAQNLSVVDLYYSHQALKREIEDLKKVVG
jgi:hypothetical protein